MSQKNKVVVALREGAQTLDILGEGNNETQMQHIRMGQTLIAVGKHKGRKWDLTRQGKSVTPT